MSNSALTIRLVNIIYITIIIIFKIFFIIIIIIKFVFIQRILQESNYMSP